MTASLTFTGTANAAYTVPGTHTSVGGWQYDSDGVGIVADTNFSRLFESAVGSGVIESEINITMTSGAAYWSNAAVIFMDSSLNGVKIEVRGDAITVVKEIAGSGGATVASLSVDNTNSTFTLKATLNTSNGALVVYKNGTSVITTTYTDFLSNLRPGMQTYRDNSIAIPVNTLNTITGPVRSIDSLTSPIRPGSVLNITTTGLGTLTTATTIGGKAIASANATGGDGTITVANFVNGQSYPAMGSVTVIASDGTSTATLTGQTLTTLPGYATVTIASPFDESAASLFNAWPPGDPPQSGEVVHYPDDGTGTVNSDLTLTDFAAGEHTFWVRRYDGIMYSFAATISGSGSSGIVAYGLTTYGLANSGIIYG